LRSTVTQWRINAVGAALAAIFLVQIPFVAIAAGADCRDTDSALDYWRPIHEQARNSNEPADSLALELIPCLGSPNPELRDRIGYELFTYWLRSEKLTDSTRHTLLRNLRATMMAPPDAGTENSALARSFSALILSELMRSDSTKPFMTAEERQTLLDSAISSIEGEVDYRGLDAEIGWVHPVAHMSDLLWRFALHAETTTGQAESILDGIRSKVAPTTVSYRFNESDRLARVVTTIISRELVDAENLGTWIAAFEKPTSMQKWSDAFASPEGMAELHNTKLFLRALADQLEGAEIDTGITAPLFELVKGFTQLI
jgi:hypothetical protein